MSAASASNGGAECEAKATRGLRYNIAANYTGQIYVTLLGMIMLPIYVHYLGIEAYGLVGFYAVLNASLQFLDFGFTPVMARELARFGQEAAGTGELWAKFRTLEWLFLSLGGLCGLSFALSSGWVSRTWLEVRQLALEEVTWCLLCMAGMMTTRWLTGLYRAGLTGLEQMMVLNVANVVLATVKAVGAWLVLRDWTNEPHGFFLFQLVFTGIELGVMRTLIYRALPPVGSRFPVGWKHLRGMLRLTGSMTLLSGLWIVVSHTDRLVLSWLLNLHDYGVFMMVITLAGGISLVAGPLGTALQPRYAKLAAAGDLAGLTKLYRLGSQLTAAMVFGVAGVMACFPTDIFRAWAGNSVLKEPMPWVLTLYALGNAWVAMLTVAFLFQFAFGNLRLHLIGNLISSAISIPAVYWMASRHGALGASCVWFAVNVGYSVLWVPFVLHRLVPGLGWRWVLDDVLSIAAVQGLALILVSRWDWSAMSRIGVILVAGSVTFPVIFSGLLVGAETRKSLWRLMRKVA